MAYGGFKDLSRRIVSSQILHDEAFNICKKTKTRWISKCSCFNGL